MDTIVSFAKEILCEELNNSILIVEDRAYVKHIFVNTFYNSNPEVMSSENGRLNQLFRYKVKEYQDCMNQGEYADILMLIERPWRLNWVYEFRELIKNNLGIEGYYEIVAEAYNDTENAWQYKNEVIELFYFGNQPHLMMGNDEKADFLELPDELKVYRGVCLNEMDSECDFLGSSWSLDFDKAKWFATRSGFEKSAYPLVFSMTINKGDVLSYFTRRNESEILIDYTKIDLEKVEFIYPKKKSNQSYESRRC